MVITNSLRISNNFNFILVSNTDHSLSIRLEMANKNCHVTSIFASTLKVLAWPKQKPPISSAPIRPNMVGEKVLRSRKTN